jgi:beta-N-acetylhexosaminidase
MKRTVLMIALGFSLIVLLLFAGSRVSKASRSTLLGVGASADAGEDADGEDAPPRLSPGSSPQFSLSDYYSDNGALDDAVEEVISSLDERGLISQMVMVACGGGAKGFGEVEQILRNRLAAGVLFMGQTRESVRMEAEALAASSLHPLFAVDGEPSLIDRAIMGMERYPMAEEISDEETCREVADSITQNLQELGIQMNFAPVCDFDLTSPVIGSRAFGHDASRVSLLSETFVSATQSRDVAATAKHFPGHGAANGDTHRMLALVRGKPPEIPVFARMVEAGVVSIMVGHMEVAGPGLYNSHGKPASLSRTIVTDLLREEMRFGGIIVSDALNMHAVDGSPFPSMEAVEAGCDLILWPRDEERFMREMMRRVGEDDAFRRRVLESVRRLIRLKVCLGLMNTLDNPSGVDDIYL